MASSSLLKSPLHNSVAQAVFDEIQNRNARYYYFLGKTLAWEDETSPPFPIDSFDYELQARNEIITLKEIKSTDVAFIIPRVDWSAGQIWDMYDDQYSDIVQGINLISGGLRNKIEADTPAENINFDIDIDNLDPYVKYESVFNFSGYMLVDSEIFEYDAIQFEYLPVSAADSDAKTQVWLSSIGDWAKYRALSKTGTEYFKPTGKLRIKRRGVFRTQQTAHAATSGVADGWYKVPEDVWV